MLASTGYCLREKVADASAYLPLTQRRIGLLHIRVDVAGDELISGPIPRFNYVARPTLAGSGVFMPQPTDDLVPDEDDIYVSEHIACEGYRVSPDMCAVDQAQHVLVDQRG
eukprot:5163718-Alexandrium_andersonii.AAC.1